MNSAESKVHYARHLAAVNQVKPVVIAQDILSETGAVVAVAGGELSRDLAGKLGRHRLAQTLDLSVHVEGALTGADLFKYLVEQRKHPDIKALVKKGLLLDVAERECSKLANYPMVLQKLTVLKQQLPEVYDGAVMCGYIALLIGHELKLNASDQNTVFLAGLTRDVGFLHVDPELLSVEHVLSPVEWTSLQTHVVISYQFLKEVPGISEAVLKAVLEHHERTDGLGYPRQKLSRELCLNGQVVAFADTAIGLFKRYVISANYRLNALEPVFQLNTGLHTVRVSKAALRVMDAAFDASPIEVEHNTSAMIPTLLRRQSYVNNWFQIAKETHQVLSGFLSDSIAQRANAFISRIQSVMTTSGVLDELFIDWLKSVRDKPLSITEKQDIEHFALMLNEAAWQFNQSYLAIAQMVQEVHLQLTPSQLKEVEHRSRLLRELLTRFHNDTV